jgi:predicted transcriptional regulator
LDSKLVILKACAEGGAGWSDLLKLTNVKKSTLYQHLTELMDKQLIVKDQETGLYKTTQKGKDELKIMLAQQAARVEFETTQLQEDSEDLYSDGFLNRSKLYEDLYPPSITGVKTAATLGIPLFVSSVKSAIHVVKPPKEFQDYLKWLAHLRIDSVNIQELSHKIQGAEELLREGGVPVHRLFARSIWAIVPSTRNEMMYFDYEKAFKSNMKLTESAFVPRLIRNWKNPLENDCNKVVGKKIPLDDESFLFVFGWLTNKYISMSYSSYSRTWQTLLLRVLRDSNLIS